MIVVSAGHVGGTRIMSSAADVLCVRCVCVWLGVSEGDDWV